MTYTEKNISTTWLVLKITFGVVPLVAGIDKFFNILADWEGYLNVAISNAVPASTFMSLVGVIEIAAGILILTQFTKVGAYIVASWLVLLSINLLTVGQFDIAVRDLTMAVGAFSLGQLTK